VKTCGALEGVLLLKVLKLTLLVFQKPCHKLYSLMYASRLYDRNTFQNRLYVGKLKE
jgi:hypothetical protein